MSTPAGRRQLLVRGALALVAAVAVSLAATAPAGAATVKMSLQISPGTLNLAVGQVGTLAVTLNGSDHQPAVTVPLTVVDSRGSGSGWHVTITSTAFSTSGTSPRLLPAGATTVTAVTVGCAGSGSCIAPVNSVAYPLALPAGATPPSPVKLIGAAAESGLGSFAVVATLRVDVPATVHAGAYTAALTIAVVSGP